MGLGEMLMKVVIKVQDVVTLARRFEASPRQAMREVIEQIHSGVSDLMNRLMEAEIEVFLGQGSDSENKRNGYRSRTFAIKGIGEVRVRVPRDRKGKFVSNIVPPGRRYDEAIEKDLALLHLAGLSTRMLSYLSRRFLDVKVSPQEVSNALHTIVPAAKAFLERPLSGRRFLYLYADGTNFAVRRTTVEREPTLVVIGVDETYRKSVLAMIQGQKENRACWAMVFANLKERGVDAGAVQLGVMDGLPGLEDEFRTAFPNARTARCWLHKARNVFPLVPHRYQAAFKKDWDSIAYAKGASPALDAFVALKQRWTPTCGDAVARLERDIGSLLIHYEFPQELWDALRTTNPIERVNKEFKRRSKAMETIGPDGLKALLAFTALRLEFGWAIVPINTHALNNLKNHRSRDEQLDAVTKGILN